MHCEEVQREIEVGNFGADTLQLSARCQAHLSQCRECQDYAKEYALPEILRVATRVDVPGDLENRLLDSIVQQAKDQSKTHHFSPSWWMMSAAATFFVVVGLVVWNIVQTQDPIPTFIQVSVEEVHSIRLMVATDRALPDADMRIAVSDNIAVSGFDQLRELKWKTNLKQGNNLLVLPIQLLQPSDGKIEVVLEHEGARKSYTINVSPKSNDANYGAISI